MHSSKNIYYEKFYRDEDMHEVQDGEASKRVQQKKRRGARTQESLQSLYEEGALRDISQQGWKRVTG